jgi:4-aminobutyrate aminotransferase-like enzyme
MVKYDGNLKMEEELAKLSWPEAPKIATKLPGPKSKEILEKEDAYETVAEMAPRGIPIAWGEAFGSTVKDPDGNLFIDLVAGVATNNVGHSHPKVVEVIRRECAILMHTGGAPNISKLRLGEKLSQIAHAILKEVEKDVLE